MCKKDGWWEEEFAWILKLLGVCDLVTKPSFPFCKWMWGGRRGRGQTHKRIPAWALTRKFCLQQKLSQSFSYGKPPPQTKSSFFLPISLPPFSIPPSSLPHPLPTLSPSTFLPSLLPPLLPSSLLSPLPFPPNFQIPYVTFFLGRPLVNCMYVARFGNWYLFKTKYIVCCFLGEFLWFNGL